MAKRKYNDVKVYDMPSIKTGMQVFDNFLSNEKGFQLGNLILLTGTSGAGKTTLCKLVQRAIGIYSHFHSLEGLASSVERQTSRIKIDDDVEAYITDEKDYADFDDFMKFLYDECPRLLIVDSLQHAAMQLIKKGMGHDAAYHHVFNSLFKWKDETQAIVILICQLNKDGSFEGPAGMLFNSDARIHMEFNAKKNERTMESVKNRMGSLDLIHYELTNCDAIIKFYTKDEWIFLKQQVSLSDMVNKVIESYLVAISSHKNYPAFKVEFLKCYNKIYKENDSDLEIIGQVLKVIEELKIKFIN